jgi:hypothetical protein
MALQTRTPTGGIGTQIRGPQIRGPQARDELVQECDIASAPVSIVIADTDLDVILLSAKWPASSVPGWLVSTSITSQELSQAYDQSGGDLNVLIAQDFDDLTSIVTWWQQG